jgi:hypothetical protein
MPDSDGGEETRWTQPPWTGWIESTGDALLILEAARRGLIPRVTRRLVESERKMITSGSVFVFDEDESGIKRWTDGFFWSPSRILGNFLLYRETEKRGAGLRGNKVEHTEELPLGGDGSSLSRPKGEPTGFGIDKARERVLVGSLTNSYKFKSGGMVKKVSFVAVAIIHLIFLQTFSLTINGIAQHLISYYKVEDVEEGRLRSPSSLPEIASLDISPEYLDKQHFRLPPKIEMCLDGVPRYRGEADDIDHSVDLLGSPLTAGMPLIADGRSHDGETSKRGKRYDPYGSPTKRGRKSRKNPKPAPAPDSLPSALPQSGQEPLSSPTLPTTSPQPQFQSQPPPQSLYPFGMTVQQPGYPDPSVSFPHYPHYGALPHYPPMPGYPMPTFSAPPAVGSPQNHPPPAVPSTPPQQFAYPGYHPDPAQQGYTYYPPWAGYNAYGGTWQYSYPPSSGPPQMTPSTADSTSDEAGGVAVIQS